MGVRLPRGKTGDQTESAEHAVFCGTALFGCNLTVSTMCSADRHESLIPHWRTQLSDGRRRVDVCWRRESRMTLKVAAWTEVCSLLPRAHRLTLSISSNCLLNLLCKRQNTLILHLCVFIPVLNVPFRTLTLKDPSLHAATDPAVWLRLSPLLYPWTGPQLGQKARVKQRDYQCHSHRGSQTVTQIKAVPSWLSVI